MCMTAVKPSHWTRLNLYQIVRSVPAEVRRRGAIWGGFKSEVQHPRYQWIVAPVFSAATCINSLKTWIGVRQSRVSRGRLLSRSAMESRAS